jgi:hypothetical protein
MIRLLKIAVSAFSLAACVVLIVFWIRSSWTADEFAFPLFTKQGYLGSLQGVLSVGIEHAETSLWRWTSYKTTPYSVAVPGAWEYMSERRWSGLGMPYWLPVAVTVFFSAVPWLGRFNLKTLLGVMTFWAVVMGVIAYQAR